jgi:hypothetical protein
MYTSKKQQQYHRTLQTGSEKQIQTQTKTKTAIFFYTNIKQNKKQEGS